MADVIIQYNRPSQSFNIYCYCQLDNTPQTGLTDVRINTFEWDSGAETKGTQVITNQILTEMDSVNLPGWYLYNWSTFIFEQDYVIDYDTATLGVNAIDIEYLNISKITEEEALARLQLLLDLDNYDLFKPIQIDGTIGIIQKL